MKCTLLYDVPSVAEFISIPSSQVICFLKLSRQTIHGETCCFRGNASYTIVNLFLCVFFLLMNLFFWFKNLKIYCLFEQVAVWFGDTKNTHAQVQNKSRVSRKLFQSPFVVGWFDLCNSFVFTFQKEKKKALMSSRWLLY